MDFNEKLRSWFLANRRSFPWREDPTPYKVWISEVMLQQTRANVVVAYFERWIEQFPDIASLAKAPFERLLKAWEGLGYYARMRNLQKAAQEICEKFAGKIPSSEEDLSSLPGIGPYTRGAILAFGFHKRKAAVDANALRAMARFFQIEEDLTQEKNRRKLFLLQEKTLPKKDPHLIVEAWIELGALLCQPLPKCEGCPLQEECLAFKNHKTKVLPFLNKKKKIERIQRAVLVLEKEEKWLLRRVPKGEVMADLWEFPYFDFKKKEISARKMQQWALSFLGIDLEKIEVLEKEEQTFTSYRAKLFPFFASCRGEIQKKNPYLWVDKRKIPLLSFSSGHRRILKKIMERK